MTPDRRRARRPHPCVILRILHALLENGEMQKTKLAWASNQNYAALEECLLFLWEEGMITTSLSESGHVVVKITDAGIAAIPEMERWYLPAWMKKKSDRPDRGR